VIRRTFRGGFHRGNSRQLATDSTIDGKSKRRLAGDESRRSAPTIARGTIRCQQQHYTTISLSLLFLLLSESGRERVRRSAPESRRHEESRTRRRHCARSVRTADGLTTIWPDQPDLIRARCERLYRRRSRCVYARRTERDRERGRDEERTAESSGGSRRRVHARRLYAAFDQTSRLRECSTRGESRVPTRLSHLSRVSVGGCSSSGERRSSRSGKRGVGTSDRSRRRKTEKRRPHNYSSFIIASKKSRSFSRASTSSR